jgi:hypothetical protein
MPRLLTYVSVLAFIILNSRWSKLLRRRGLSARLTANNRRLIQVAGANRGIVTDQKSGLKGLSLGKRWPNSHANQVSVFTRFFDRLGLETGKRLGKAPLPGSRKIESPKVWSRLQERNSHLFLETFQRFNGRNPALLFFLRCHVDHKQGFTDLNRDTERHRSSVRIHYPRGGFFVKGSCRSSSPVDLNAHLKGYSFAASLGFGCSRWGNAYRPRPRAGSLDYFAGFDGNFSLDTMDRAFKIPWHRSNLLEGLFPIPQKE